MNPAPCPSRILLWAGSLTALLWGCGQAQYDLRLKETAAFYRYQQQLNDQLGPIWQRPDLGLSMRLPHPFRNPLPADDHDHPQRPPEADPRQPADLKVTLPGLISAWQAQIPGPDGEPERCELYLLGNHSRRDSDPAEGASFATFLPELESLLTTALGVTIAEGEILVPVDNLRYRHTVPPGGTHAARYLRPKEYSSLRLVPRLPVNERSLQALLYERRVGEIQVAVLILAPKGIPEAFQQRIDLALATLEIAANPPGRQQSDAADP